MEKADRYFDPDPAQKRIAIALYERVKSTPIVSPHGHVDPALFVDPDYRFSNPAALLVQSDHYILRMLYSQGIGYDLLLSDEDPYRVWETFATHFHLFRGTPSGLWIVDELERVFGITEKLDGSTARAIYEKISNVLSDEGFTPRNLYKQFNIEVLSTTDSATDSLAQHQGIRESGWDGKVIPTFRPDDLLKLRSKKWVEQINTLSDLTGITINRFSDFIQAVERRREAFKAIGATAIDLGVPSPVTARQEPSEIDRIFTAALKGEATEEDAQLFAAQMLYEMARMSSEDGMVMQIHPGVYRNHNPGVYRRFGPDMGFDIPMKVEFTQNLQPLLADFGDHPNFRLILFTVDESAYSRELAPLAGAYPAIRLGPPWWFLDSWQGMKRYFANVMETAGIYNTVGFNDDTRAFLSIPARHDVWRRAAANWLASLVVRGMIDAVDAEDMIFELAVGLTRSAYNL
ncbi:glucuronate isomerase [bacterium]|nr:glucuronate isomerase [bacterium]